MTSQQQPLQAVARVRTSNEEAAARQLGEAQKALSIEQSRTNELLGYLHEYEHAPAVASVHWLANRAQFLSRLQDAITAQTVRLRQAEQAVEACRTRYILARQDCQVLDRLEAGYRRAAEYAQEQRAQAAIDEWVASRHGTVQ